MLTPTNRHRLVGSLVAIALLAGIPLAVMASDRFQDVPDSNTFHDDIAWLADADVTRGCNPPANTQFCPSDNVTREQMAAFMKRLANNRVVDAGKLDGKDPVVYTTQIWAASCGSEADGEMIISNCLPSSDGSVDGGTVIDVFTLEAQVPAAGALQLSSTAIAGTAGTIFSFTIDEDCAADPATFVDLSVNGHIWGPVGNNSSTAAHITTPISAGDHTIRLCALNVGMDPSALATASLSALWIPSGTVTVAGSDSHPVDLPILFDG